MFNEWINRFLAEEIEQLPHKRGATARWYWVLKSRRVAKKLGMWEHQREALSIHKRLSQREDPSIMDVEEDSERLDQQSSNPPWTYSLPHVLAATMSSFLYGYHLGVANEPLESISQDLGLMGIHWLKECPGGASFGSLFSGWIADGVGRRRVFQLCAMPMILGAFISAKAQTLTGMLIGRLLVGSGMGLGPPVASLSVTEVSPAFVRGTYGSFTAGWKCAI